MFAFEGKEYDFGAPAPTVAVALSGGPDSMALCRLLSLWGRETGTRILALTVDHGLRPEAAAEAARAGEWIKDWPQVRHEILKLEMPAGGARIMETARERRYEALFSRCRAQGIGRVFVAHHRDDQAETFLFRLAKGSGLDGLCAMRREQEYEGGITVVRPFLDIPKAELVEFCTRHGVPFVADPTNDDAQYARPRLRRARAVLEEEGLTSKRLVVTAARLSRARDALDFYAAEAFRKYARPGGADEIILDLEGLKGEPEETRLRAIMAAMEKLAPGEGGYGPRMEKMEEIVRALFAAAPFRRQTLGGFIFARGRDAIVIRREMPCLPGEKV